jgi:hypothetical protein
MHLYSKMISSQMSLFDLKVLCPSRWIWLKEVSLYSTVVCAKGKGAESFGKIYLSAIQSNERRGGAESL